MLLSECDGFLYIPSNNATRPTFCSVIYFRDDPPFLSIFGGRDYFFEVSVKMESLSDYVLGNMCLHSKL